MAQVQSKSDSTEFKTVYGVPEGQDARHLIARARELAKEKKTLIHIALDETRLSALEDLIRFFGPDIQFVSFPAWDCLPYDRVGPNTEIVAQRISALAEMLEWKADDLFKPRIILTTVNAIMQRVMSPEHLLSAHLSVKKKGRLDQKKLTAFLIDNGYTKTETVREAGEFAIRGGIIDLFPTGQAEPVRIDLFGDEVESVRSFDPSSQRTISDIAEFSLRPVTEFFMTPDAIEKFRSAYRQLFGVNQASDPLYNAVSEGRKHSGIEHWQPLFFDSMATLFDYINRPVLSFDTQAEPSRHERLTQIHDFYQARQTLDKSLQEKKKKKESDVSLSGGLYHPLPPKMLYIENNEFDTLIADTDPEILQSFASPKEDGKTEARKAREFGDIRAQANLNLFREVGNFLKTQLSDQRKVVIACYSQGSRDRLKLMMEDNGVSNLVICDTADDIRKLKSPQIGFTILFLEHGFIAADLAVITEQDILGDRLARKGKRRKKADNFLKEVSALAPGDLVVHIDHGVGRFEGLETLKAGGILHDCLKLVYHGGDKLFVPVENIEVLSRFGNEDSNVDLDKLGSGSWQARKAKVKKDLMIMAEGLLKIAAERQLREADKLDIHTGPYNEFASRFPYQETDDQLRAISDSLSDLMSGHPMDRLVCGDVGFGKTEIAMRAAYVAASNGMQVAIIAPTTLLARQHFNGFTERFKGLGFRIVQLSRLVTAKDAKSAKDEIEKGSATIVIGTHALLGGSIKFHNLGLVIVDEEQRFGVKQKEKLKELKANVHVLTLTATPIPRTLQMALSGVRDMSIIATPPVDRLAIRTFVMPTDPLVLREAILREHYRGGQSFYVCPRIKDMEALEEMLKDLVPEVKTIAAHGQMTPTELEDRMTAFYEGQYGILLATNIIESGLDIPAANTIIVHRADLFGLSQLYQIRGRVGRSKVRAYAYLTYDPQKQLTSQAQKRLEVFETLDSLGAGFQLASHDLDIRGGGNLLGEEQSGHIKEVGIELYQQMLEDAVAASRAGIGKEIEIPDTGWSPVINIGTSVLIPEAYVVDLSVRMSLYRRLAELETGEDIESFAAELIDRFGDLPEEVKNLLDIVKIKQLCRTAGVSHLEAGPKGAVIGFYKDAPPNRDNLIKWFTEKGSSVKYRPDHKITLSRNWESAKDRVKAVANLAGELARLAG